MKNHENRNSWVAVWVLALIFFVALSLLVRSAGAQEWLPTNQMTVGWDAVTQTTEGSPLTPEEVQYRVYRADPLKTNIEVVGTTALTQYTITFETEGRWLVGVQSLRFAGADLVGESSIIWSDDPEVLAAGQDPFGVIRFAPPEDAKGLYAVSP